MRTDLSLFRLAAFELVAATALAGLAPLFDVAGVASTSWWTHAGAAELLGALSWWFAALLCAWTVLGTVVGVATRAVPRLRALRRLDRLNVPFVRRALDRALAVSMAATAVVAVATPASAATTSTAPTRSHVRVHVTQDGELVVAPDRAVAPAPASTSTTTTTTTTTVAPARPAPRPTPVAASPFPTPSSVGSAEVSGTTNRSVARAAVPGATAAARYMVRPGDNLWRIAAAHLDTTDDDVIVCYWRRVVAANRATLRSGDPNLIFPGELVDLPPLV
jgi:hypothetical protein